MNENKLNKKHVYANVARAGFNTSELVIEFGMHFDEEDEPQYHTHIIMHPDNAKELIRVLMDTYKQYTNKC